MVVHLLGALSISAWGTPVGNGLRSRASALLAWYLVHPEGATPEAAVDALWPKTRADQVQRQFWRALGDLRSRLRGPSGERVDVLEKVGDRYRPAPDEVGCDLWDFQAALDDAARAPDDGAATEALWRAVTCYNGDLLQSSDYLWVEPVRHDLRRRAVDAHFRLADLERGGRRPERAIAVLERALDIDRHAEEPYRRLMAIYAEQGRLDAVTGTWRLLGGRLAEVDLEIEGTTIDLYRSLTGGPGQPDRRQGRMGAP